MKTSIITTKKRIQLVLEPEDEYDKEVIKVLAQLPNTHKDNFYSCEGGWSRFGDYRQGDDLVMVFNKQ